MEDNFSKRTILLLFAILLASFLFIYKGFFLNGTYYLEAIDEYKLSVYSAKLSNNITSSPQSTLKRTRLSDTANKGDSIRAKGKIPKELSTIDNNLFELKAFVQNLNDKQSNVIKSIDEMHLDSLSNVSKDLHHIKEQQMTIETSIDDLSSNVERLRDYF